MIWLNVLLALFFQGTTDWNGQYMGSFQDQQASATLQEQNDNITGELLVANYPYQIRATVVDNWSARGQLVDQATGGELPLQLQLNGNQLTLNLEAMQIVLIKQGTPKAGGPLGQPQVKRNTSQESVERDQGIIGSWLYSKSYTSGDSFGGVTETSMIIRADGTYQYGGSQVAGGDASVSFQSGGGDWSSGEWKTANGIIYIKEQGSANWTAYCEYVVDYENLLFTFEDGTKMLWNRN